ncbi:hypothetical protein CRG98_038734 [Punica granatum]|uniref:Pectate lyase superfamily protein domain-containing protein n=1 Tax=Punica granatum TaxID=22663 RepID=A0A2I0IAT8_PUNGR|nr:hypothetical protein CRG98_038734 [Punica granatum]
MDNFRIPQLVLCIAIVQVAQAQAFNVLNYGARGDGITDDSKAFNDAWAAACGSALGSPTLQIPQGKKFLLKPVTFKGPCKSSTIHVQLKSLEAYRVVSPRTPTARGNLGPRSSVTRDAFDNLADGGGQCRHRKSLSQ